MAVVVGVIELDVPFKCPCCKGYISLVLHSVIDEIEKFKCSWCHYPLDKDKIQEAQEDLKKSQKDMRRLQEELEEAEADLNDMLEEV